MSAVSPENWREEKHSVVCLEGRPLECQALGPREPSTDLQQHQAQAPVGGKGEERGKVTAGLWASGAGYFHPSSVERSQTSSFAKPVHWLSLTHQKFFKLILAIKPMHDLSVLFPFKVKNLNTGSSRVCHLQLWLTAWEETHRSANSGDTASLSSTTDLGAARASHSGARVWCPSPPGTGGKGGSYRVLLQLQPLPIGKGGASLGGVPVGGGHNGPCLLLHSEHFAAGLVLIVCALPGIDNPGEEARKSVRVISENLRASPLESANPISTPGTKLSSHLMQKSFCALE